MEKEPLHILLVDDDENDRMLFQEAFSELKIKTEVRTLKDGVELMEFLNKEDVRLPEYLFLDINMPRKNGLECLKEIRSNEKLKDIYIAIYSTSRNEKDIDETFLSGANVYITKPTDFKLLKKMLHKSVAATLIYQGNTFNRDNFILKL